MPPQAPADGLRDASWEDIITAIAKREKVNPMLALSVAQKESGMDPKAIGDAGKAIGLFQMHSGAAQDAGIENRGDPIQNITGGIRYLRQLSDRYDGDPTKILTAYNGGMGNVDKGTISPAAQAYAADVMAQLSQRARTSQTRPKQATAPPAAATAGMMPSSTVEGDPARVRPGGILAGASPGLAARFASAVGEAVPPEKILPLSGALVGGAKGATAGAAVGGPVGAVLGGVAGAGAGAGGGELAQTAIEQLSEYFGFSEPSRPITVRDVAGRASAEANTAMMGQALGEAGLRILTPVAKKVMAPMASKLSNYAREAMQTFPGRVIPSEVSESRALNIAENIAEGSIFGGGAVADAKAARQGVAESKVLEVLEQLGPQTTVRAAGAGAQSGRMAAVQQFRGQENAAWDAFRTAAGDIPATTPKLDAFMGELQGQEAGAILPNAGAEAARRIANLAGDEATGMQQLIEAGYGGLNPEALAAAAAQIPSKGGMTVVQFQKTVSDLGKLTRALEQSAKVDPSKHNAQLGLAKKLYNLAREDLDASLAQSPAAQAAFQSAANVSKMGNQRLFNAAVMQVAKQEPEKVVGVLLRPNQSTAIEAVREAVGKENFAPIQRQAMQQLTMPDPRTGQINWARQAQRLQALGDDTLNALFPDGHAQEVQRISRLMLQLSQHPAGSIGKTGIFLTQWGPLIAAGGAVGTGTLPPAGGLVVLSAPYVMAKIMTNPTATKWLTTGLTAPAGSAQAIRAGAMLTAFLKQDLPQPVASHEPETPVTQ